MFAVSAVFIEFAGAKLNADRLKYNKRIVIYCY